MNLNDRLSTWRDILREYRKQNASVLCTTKVSYADASGTVQMVDHSLKAIFLSAGKPVPVYKVLISNEYVGTVRFSLASMNDSNDGIQTPVFSGNPPMHFFLMEIAEAYLIFNFVSGSGLHINNGVDFNDAAIGPYYLLGWTTPEDGDDPKFNLPSRGLSNAAQVGA